MSVIENIEGFTHTKSNGKIKVKAFRYKGLKAAQVFGVENAFDQLSETTSDNPVKTIIEIGSSHCGLTNLLADLSISDNASIHSFDINRRRFKSYNNKIQFYTKNVFKNQNCVLDLIQREGRTLLLCDGGDKKREFEIFHHFLKDEDIIMAHDYAPTHEIFKRDYLGKIWNTCEFIEKSADFDGLEPFMQDVFDKYAWCIRIKKNK